MAERLDLAQSYKMYGAQEREAENQAAPSAYQQVRAKLDALNCKGDFQAPPHHAATSLSQHVADVVAPFRREYIADALDGMAYQAQGAIRFLERGEDAPAAAAMARAFDFARKAAAEMRELQGERA